MAENPEPETVTYAGLREVLQRFVDDLAIAEGTLAQVPRDTFDLTLDLSQIRVDLNGDGRGDSSEGLLAIVNAVAGPVRSRGNNFVDFDQSDAPWLQGYCHLLSAMSEFLLAHDWEAAFDLTFHDLFPESDLPTASLRWMSSDFWEYRESLMNADGSPPRYDASKGPYEDWLETEEGHRRKELDRIERSMSFSEDISYIHPIADLIAFVHLMHWPVEDAEKMAAVRTHLLQMVSLSRENWRRIRAEKDWNAPGRKVKMEWIPGPVDQTGAFGNLRVTSEVVDGWHMFLYAFEDTLNGDLLIPHWRFPHKGVNLRRMFEEPSTFDPILIAQGSAVLPYLEPGDMVSDDMLGTSMTILQGGLLAYFLWFN